MNRRKSRRKSPRRKKSPHKSRSRSNSRSRSKAARFGVAKKGILRKSKSPSNSKHKRKVTIAYPERQYKVVPKISLEELMAAVDDSPPLARSSPVNRRSPPKD